jgi:hypothetical protein
LGGAGVKVQNRLFFWDTDAGWESRFNSGGFVDGSPYLRTAIGFQSGWAAVEAGVLVNPQLAGGGSSDVTLGPLSLGNDIRWFAGVRLF